MADLYRVIYTRKHKDHGSVVVSATSPANAVTAATSNDAQYKDTISVTGLGANIVVGS